MRKHLTFANMLSLFAVFMVLGGSAVAATAVITKSSQVKNGALTGADLKKGSVGADRLSAAAQASLKGQTGATGPQGAQGPAGPAGAAGAKGETGAAGPRGLQGEKGATGDQGPQGEKGDTGAAGENGAPGQDGAPGLDGLPGADGAPGPQGEQGPQGDQGPQGEQGPEGPAGAPVRAYASVDTSTVDLLVRARSRNIGGVTRAAVGTYCVQVAQAAADAFDDTGNLKVTPIVSPDITTTANLREAIQAFARSGTSTSCPSTPDAPQGEVRTWRPNNAFATPPVSTLVDDVSFNLLLP